MQIEPKPPGGPPTLTLPTRGPQDAGRFARLLALAPEQSGEHEGGEPPSSDGPARDERRDRDKPSSTPEAARQPAAAEPPRGGAAEPPSGARAPVASPRVSSLPEGWAERMLQQVHVQQLPDGSSALQLRVCTGRFVDLDVDLRFERGRVRAAFGTAEGHSYRLLRGSLSTLEEALATRGVAAHPIRLELRRPAARSVAKPAAAARAPRRGQGGTGGRGRLL